MNDLSIHLTERVLPHVPIRHWVCTPPWALRYRLGFDREACSLFVRALSEALFSEALGRSMQHRAKDALGLRSVQDAEVGALTFIQRTDSALRLSPHLHVAQLDGVYVRDSGGTLQFHALPDPTEDDVAGVAIVSAARMRRGLELGEVDTEDPLAELEPLLAQCYAASALGRQAFGEGAGRPVLRRIDQATRSVAPGGQHVAESKGFQVFCDHPIEADDRRSVSALCRYLNRPPLKQDRLERLCDGRFCYRMKRTFRDRTSAIVLTGVELIARLAAMVPQVRGEARGEAEGAAVHGRRVQDLEAEDPSDLVRAAKAKHELHGEPECGPRSEP